MIHHLLQKYVPDIAIITETDLRPEEVSQISLSGYRCTSPPISKQLKILVLAFTRSDVEVDLGMMKPDVPAVSIRLPHLKLSVVGVYRQHHGGLMKPQMTEMSSIKGVISALNPSDVICLAGDFNLDARRLLTGCQLPPFYRSWKDYSASLGLDLLRTSPTFKSFGPIRGKHHISTLDHVYVSSSIPASATALPDAATDHFPVLACIEVGKKLQRSQGEGLETVTRRNLLAIDRDSFVNDLKQIGVDQWPVAPEGCDVNGMIEDFYSVINPVIERHAPKRTFKVRRDTPPLLLSKETREAMRERDKARQKGGDYKMLRNKCVKLVHRDRMHTAVQTLSGAPDKQAAAWRHGLLVQYSTEVKPGSYPSSRIATPTRSARTSATRSSSTKWRSSLTVSRSRRRVLTPWRMLGKDSETGQASNYTPWASRPPRKPSAAWAQQRR